MTREEAILCLKGIKNYGRDIFTEQSDWQDSLDMAIKALEQEPCEDAISRQAVLDILKDKWDLYLYADDAIQESIDKIRAIPSVTPWLKTGRWITKFHGFPPEPTTVCSECGFDRELFISSMFSGDGLISFRGWDKIKYCPNCGAKTVEPQESEKNT